MSCEMDTKCLLQLTNTHFASKARKVGAIFEYLLYILVLYILCILHS